MHTDEPRESAKGSQMYSGSNRLAQDKKGKTRPRGARRATRQGGEKPNTEMQTLFTTRSATAPLESFLGGGNR